MKQLHIPGLAAVKIEQGTISWTRYFGSQDIERAIPVSEKTVFHVASISKTITAAASNVGVPLTKLQAEFWYLVECQGSKELAHSLKIVHYLALYLSDIPFDQTEKSALFDLKVLASLRPRFKDAGARYPRHDYAIDWRK